MDQPSTLLTELPALTDVESHRSAIDAVRVLSMDAVQRANSGHPGAPMGLAPLGYLVWTRHLRHNPADPHWLDRDRFVLSIGHASMLLYSLLHLTGYDLSLEEIQNFRQWGSATPGHPEVGRTPGVEMTTGPLGQGVASSVGMAITERWLAHRFNRPGHEVVDHHTYVFCSDGDLMEGVSHEAAELAGHQRLGKLIWVFDDNHITIEGDTALSSSTNQRARFEGYGWHVQTIDDGNDLSALDHALKQARVESERPSLIAVRTTIAYGSPGKAGHHSTHGSPLGEAEVAATKQNLDYPSSEAFYVDPAARELWGKAGPRGAELQAAWSARFEAYRSDFPELAYEFLSTMAGELPPGWDDALSGLEITNPEATRASSGRAIQALASGIPNLVGGSADLGPSNKTDIDGGGSLLPGTPGGRVIHFGVREHAMGSIANGMALHGGVRPFVGTFLIFSDYMRPAIRLAALMGQRVTYVFTHDSIGLGEDGPTHQPIEQLAALRAIPNLLDLRPGDSAETLEAWRVAVTREEGPAFLSLTRQKVPILDRSMMANATGLQRGAYMLLEAGVGTPEVILIASGSELGMAVEARAELEGEGIGTRVVSMPSWRLFADQSAEYRDEVLPPHVEARVSMEAGSVQGWSRWVGPSGRSLGIDHFGASAPADVLFEQFGITATRMAEAARSILGRAPTPD